MIKVENENVEVRGISLDVIGEFQILCDHLNKELGEKDFAFVLGTIAGKFYKKRIAELEDDLNNASQVCAICQKEQENDRLKAELEEQERELKYYEDEWKSCQQHLDHYRGECLNLQEQVKEAMQVADKTIKVLAKALELACKHIEAYSDSCYYCPKKQYCGEKCGLDSGENECIDWLMNYFKTTARKE